MLSFQSCKAAEVKEWTFLVYLNGDNNLNYYGDKDVKEMAGVGSSDKVNIVVLRDFGKKQTSKILYVTTGTTTAVYDFKKNVDTGDYQTLINFFKFATENYPAKKYAVVVWDHGNGWMDLEGDVDMRGISYDDSSGNHISTEQMGVALEAMKEMNGGKNIDILGMDACLMAMAEVIYEVKDSVNYVVASEETEPGNGWDYLGALKPVVGNPAMTPKDFSVSLAKSYISSYPSTAVTQSSVDVSEFVKTLDVTRDFVLAVKGTNQENLGFIKSAKLESQTFYEQSYKDFGDFLSLVASKSNDSEIKKQSLLLRESIFKSIVYGGNTNMRKATGISVWLPTSTSQMESYKKLKWVIDSDWDTLIDLTL
jgi:hypothetical protein